ncbi:MAG: hypothetical protein V4548_02865 [Bacteroidota bacterium]
MRKFVYISAIVFILISCNKNKNQISKIEIKENPLFKFYKDTTFSEIYVYPDTNYTKSKFLFSGKQIDSITLSKISKNIGNGIPWTEGFYGIYSFKINKKYTGLITRIPGIYDSSVISLWLYNNDNNSVVKNIQLADVVGDAGASEIINSYLFFEKDNKIRAFTYRHYSYDHSVEEESDTIIEENRDFYLIDINGNSIDTISKNTIKLKNKFKKQLLRLSRY